MENKDSLKSYLVLLQYFGGLFRYHIVDNFQQLSRHKVSVSVSLPGSYLFMLFVLCYVADLELRLL
jgi:hypothetical protein